jgi:hypothetical protein
MYVQDSAVPDDPGERTNWDDPARWKVTRAVRARRLLVALSRLWRARRRLRHLPTFRQVRWMAAFDGRDPCSYQLNREANYAPAMLPDEMECHLGEHALCFRSVSGLTPSGQFEMVVLCDGWGFDLT